MANHSHISSMSDKTVEKFIGAFVKHHRLEQNKTQDALATSAGISRSTLSLLERGETVTVATLIQVLRILNQLQVLSVFELQEKLSPLKLAKLQKDRRQRASGRAMNENGKKEEPNW